MDVNNPFHSICVQIFPKSTDPQYALKMRLFELHEQKGVATFSAGMLENDLNLAMSYARVCVAKKEDLPKLKNALAGEQISLENEIECCDYLHACLERYVPEQIVQEYKHLSEQPGLHYHEKLACLMLLSDRKVIQRGQELVNTALKTLKKRKQKKLKRQRQKSKRN